MNSNYFVKHWEIIKEKGFLKLFTLAALENLSKYQKWVLFLIFILWFVIVFIAVTRHEYWRDEIRALSLVLDSGSWMQLSGHIKNEGHPILWYALIKASLPFFGQTFTLPILSIGIAACAVFIFLFKSPFPLVLKILFTFSILPAYEYSVMSRNYGISMLLMFAYASLYKNRKHNLLYLCMLLALLANTNFPSLIVAGLLTALLIWDILIESRDDNRGVAGGLFFGLLSFVLFAGIFSLITIKPDDRSLLTTANHIKPISEYWASVRAALLHLESNLIHFFPGESGLTKRLLPQLFVWSSVIGLAIQKRLGLCLFLYFLSFGFLQHYAYPMALRHEGIGFVFTITLYWISLSYSKEQQNDPKLYLRWIFIYMIMPFVLLWGDGKAYVAIKKDIKHSVSSSKEMGEFISNRPDLKESILIGEPDYLFEAVPYYSSATLFIQRENLFRNYGKSTNEQRQILTLGDLLKISEQLNKELRRPVLISFPWAESEFINENIKNLPYGRQFTWNKEQWNEFLEKTSMLGKFTKATSDENYYLYRLK